MRIRRRQHERLLFGLFILLLASCTLCNRARGESAGEPLVVSSSLLLNNTFGYDGMEVVYFGEAVGDVMKRGDYGWVNVYDGTYAVGVYAPSHLLEELRVLGDYSHKGDMIEVTGVFHRACREHGGDMDIHAREVRLIANGYSLEHPISMSKLSFTLMLLGVNILLLIVLNRIKNGNK